MGNGTGRARHRGSCRLRLERAAECRRLDLYAGCCRRGGLCLLARRCRRAVCIDVWVRCHGDQRCRVMERKGMTAVLVPPGGNPAMASNRAIDRRLKTVG
ncbi:hypothetical protein Acid7E03_07360 [Acidisoma sp. 7E03]